MKIIYSTSLPLLFTIIIFGLTACAPFKVSPRVEIPVTEIKAVAQTASLELRAQIPNEDEMLQLFDSNLQLAGIIPLRVTLTNRSSQSLSIKNCKLQLLGAKQKQFSAIAAKDVVNRLIKYYGIRVYSYALHEEMTKKFISHSLAIPNNLMPGETVQGLIYFKHIKESLLPTGLHLQLQREKEKIDLPL